MSIIRCLERLLLSVTPTSTRFALLLLNLGALALGIHLVGPLNERWE